jgi:hypothetical protein
MKIIRLIKPGLLIFECMRLMALVSFLALQRNDPALMTKMVFAAQGVLFPLMALFIWLDTDRYRAYLPLFAAGKCIGIFALLGWFIVSRQVTMIGSFKGIAVFAEALLMGGDFFALAAILLIIKDFLLTKTPETVEDR